MLHDGLYEQIINRSLDAELTSTDKLSQTAPIDSAEASKVPAKSVLSLSLTFITKVWIFRKSILFCSCVLPNP